MAKEEYTEEEVIRAQKIVAAQKESVESLERQMSLLEQQVSVSQDLSDLVKINEETRKKELRLAQLELENTQKQLDVLLQVRATNVELTEKQKKKLDTLLAQKKEQQKILENLQEQNKAIDGFSSKLTNAFSRLTGITGEAETLLGHTFKLTMSGADFSEGLGKALDNIRKMATPTNIIVAGLDTVVQATIMVAKAQDEAVSSFNRLAGTTGEYTDLITSTAQSNRRFGVSMSDAGAAAGSLFTSMSSFSELNKTTQQEVLKTTVQLEALGVSSATTAKNMEIATRSLGMTGTQAKNLQMELFDTAAALSLPPAAVAEGFASAAPQLAKHGTKMVDVFKDLSKASKETGVSVDKLISLTAKFDTFEGAADAAGKLNAVLGGDLLNSMDLLMADEAERIKLLQDTINNSGKAFHEMNRFEKQAVASAAGISDMTVATAIFNPQMIGMTKAQKDAAERARAVTSAGKQLTAMFESLAVIVTPIINVLKFAADQLLKLNDSFKLAGAGPVTWIIGIAAVIAVIYKLGFATKKAVEEVAEGGKKAGKGFGDGFKNAAKGISQGISSLGRGLATAITSVGAAATGSAAGLGILAVVLVTVGLAAVGVGYGIKLAAEGMAKFVAAFKDMEPGAILAFGASMLMITAAMYGFVTTAPLAIFAAAGAAVSFGLLALAMSSIGESAKSLTAFNASLTGINFTDVTTGYEKIAEAIEKVAAAINSINPINGLIFSGMMGTQISNNPVATGTPIPNTAGQAGAQRVRTAAETNAVAKVDVVAMTVNETQPRETGNEQVTAKLILKEKEIGELLLSGINNPFDKRTNQIVQTVIKGTA